MIRGLRTAVLIAAICVLVYAPAHGQGPAPAWEDTGDDTAPGEEAIREDYVSIIRDGGLEEHGLAGRPVEPGVAAELPTARIAEAAVRDFNGTDWVRNMYWRRGEFILVTDRLHVREAGEYVLASNLKVQAEPEHVLHDGRVLRIERPEGVVLVKSDGHAPGVLCEQIDDAGIRSMLMRWELAGQFEAGETRAFHTLYYDERNPEPNDWDLRRINDEAVLILRDGEPETVVVMGEEANIPGQVRMKMGAFARRAIWAAELTDLRSVLRTEQPIHGEVTAEPTTHATVIGPPDLRTISIVGMPLMLQEGRLELDLAGLGDLTTGIVELEAIFNSFVARANEPPDAEPGA